MFRDALLLGARAIVGGYVAAHGAQKLFGSFGGHGLDGTGGFFESVGLAPGKPMAATAGTSELAGGALTAAGLAHPVGPVAIASTMAVASGTVHTGQGAFASDNGPELPLANISACLALAAAGPGRLSLDGALGTRIPAKVAAAVAAGGAFAGVALVARANAVAGGEEEQQADDADEVEGARGEERRSA